MRHKSGPKQTTRCEFYDAWKSVLEPVWAFFIDACGQPVAKSRDFAPELEKGESS